MATTTPNFGWSVPTSTDLVKDGATAIETLGDSIDASLLDLKGGTSGQVLAKNSNTDMDFIWVAQDDSNAIQNAIVDAKGDIIAATAADTPARLAVGTNNQVLTADSTTATGLKWATPAAGGGLTLLQTLTLSGSSTTSSSISSAYKNIVVYVQNVYGSTLEDMLVRLNSDTGNNYYWQFIGSSATSASASGANASDYLYFALLNNTTNIGSQTNGSIKVYDYNRTDTVYYESRSFARDNSANRTQCTSGVYNNSAVISTITFLAGSATFTAGTAYIYGEA